MSNELLHDIVKKIIENDIRQRLIQHLGQLSTLIPFGLRPRGSKNSSFPRFWKVHFPAYDGNSYSLDSVSLFQMFIFDSQHTVP